MKLKAVSIQNFRRYRERIVVPLDRLTAFIGRNDAGKSTILEALDIFFESGTVTIDCDDANIGGEPANVRIGAIFSDFPAIIDLDAGAQTTLANEHLLNADGDLEIFKVYNCSVRTKVPAPKVFAHALHPNAVGIADLLQKKNPDLKKLIRDAKLESHCQLTSNPSMRLALYEAADNLDLSEKDVQLNDADAKNIWEAIRRVLPVYALFRSDRASSDQDPEVQNPMKLAIQKALGQLNDKLDEITSEIEAVAQETAIRTIEQMKISYPEVALATVLKPQFRKPNWATVFKLDLESDDGIPLNKRGSGVRRLVLLSFFQAEAARSQTEKAGATGKRAPIIYAVEEPETSQHPDHQEKIIQSFIQVAAAGDQVLLTTHVPGLAGMLPTGSVRFVDLDLASGLPRVRLGTSDVLEEVVRSLGVASDTAYQAGARVAVAVEGFTDIDALISFASVLMASGDLTAFDSNKVFWTIGGGETLKDWVERRYLDSLGIPQVFIFDSDRTSSVLPFSQDKIDRVNAINSRPECKAFLGRKRTIENYMHPDAVTRLSNGRISLAADLDLDHDNLAHEFGKALVAAKTVHGGKLGFYPDDHKGKQLGTATAENHCKKVITSYVMRHMTCEEIRERGAYVDDQGNGRNEITEWLDAIHIHLV